MPAKINCCDNVVVDAITAVVPGFKHSCISRKSRHKASKVLGSRLDDYCTVKNGRRTRTTLNPHEYYSICYRMRTKVIDEVLPPAAGGPDPPGLLLSCSLRSNN